MTCAAAAFIDAVHALQVAVDDLDGEYREACAEQVETFSTFLDRMEAAWSQVRGDWTSYASGGDTSGIQAHAKEADTLTDEFVATEVPALATACYTTADRAAPTG